MDKLNGHFIHTDLERGSIFFFFISDSESAMPSSKSFLKSYRLDLN